MTDPVARTSTPLTAWTFREWPQDTPLKALLMDAGLSAQGWRTATVPGTVQQELLALGELPDPLYGLNEHEVQWVSDRTWLYRTTFDFQAGSGEQTDLCLEGLDTLCTVYLNGEVLLESDNMFVPHRVSLRGQARPGHNELLLVFHPVLPHIHRLRDQHGPRTAWNGDPARVYLRKAPYHFGWDWGPTLLAVGPWKPVTIEHYRARLADVYPEVTVEGERATLRLSVELAGNAAGAALAVTLRDPDGQAAVQASGRLDEVNRVYEVPAPRLWWPRGQGEQALYTLEVELRQGEQVLDRHSKRLGLRRVELLQQPVEGEPGSSFTFAVNGRELFMGGTNWIPDDLLLPRLTPERYGERVGQMVDGNHLMVRVWGGGIYEDDLFYDLCDEAGLLVWQDFMFACGLYPDHPEYLESVRQEAEEAVRRLRHHPSLALWCGGNENYAVAQAVKVPEPAALSAAGGNASASGEVFVGPAIHAGVLPEVVAALDPRTPYWTDSPFGGEFTRDPHVGDRHTWDVYHGMVPIEDYRLVEGRFVSEFGMQSAPSLAAVEAVTPPEERRPYSRVMEHHQKAKGGTRRLASYLSDHFDPSPNLEQFIYDSQLLQADAMKYAYQAFRSRWGRPGARAVSGALAWQLNDVWPVSSWAIIDALGVPKPAYHAIARELISITVVLDRRAGELTAWLTSDRPQDTPVELHWEAFDFVGKKLGERRWAAVAAANAVTPLTLPEMTVPEDAVLFLRGFQDGQEVSRSSDWPRPYRFHALPGTAPRCQFDGLTLSIEADRPLRHVWIVSGAARPSDNALDLWPGETVSVIFDRPLTEPLRVQALGVPAFTVPALSIPEETG